MTANPQERTKRTAQEEVEIKGFEVSIAWTLIPNGYCSCSLAAKGEHYWQISRAFKDAQTIRQTCKWGVVEDEICHHLGPRPTKPQWRLALEYIYYFS